MVNYPAESVERSVFDFEDYKLFLRSRFPSVGQGRGMRTQLAESLGCQLAFISKVLNSEAHFSLEHAMRISEFLSLPSEDANYFLLLVSLGRSGSKALEQHYRRQVRLLLEKRAEIAQRVKAKQSLALEDQVIYYSSWVYGAIHVLVSIPEYQTKSALAKRLNVPLKQLTEQLDFLVSKGILAERNGCYSVGNARLHLDRQSPLIGEHHTQWRIRAIHSLNRKAETELHYSAALSLSREDVREIREVLLKTIERSEKIMRPSKEETAFGLLVDFFEI